MNHSYSLLTHFLNLAVLSVAMILPQGALAFDTEHYASQSALSQGRWVKISVPETGMYCLTAADLRSMGFNDPSRVRIHGYGGNRISDHLTQANYIDDVPMVQSVVTQRGVVFYAAGPEKWDYNGGAWLHSLNPFSTLGYYYVTESDEPLREPATEGGESNDATEYATTFTEHVYYESDKASPSTLGLTLVGEDFRYNTSQSFRLSTPGFVPGGKATVRVNFLSICNGQSSIAVTVDDNTVKLTGTSSFTPSADGTLGLAEGECEVTSASTTVGVRYTGGGVTTMANLDYIELLYERSLALDGGTLRFTVDTPDVELQSTVSDVTVWDVTDPLNISRITPATSGNRLRWSSPFTGARDYVAWSATSLASMPSPRMEEVVANQDIHSQPIPDMIIVTTADNMAQAQRVAELHAADRDPLTTLIVTPDQVYNEFSSGSADPAAIRKMCKMFFDRSLAATDPESKILRFLLLFGRPTYDNRRLTSDMQRAGYETIPAWTTDVALNENIAYCSDDYFAMLDDNSGLRWGNELLRVAVGRIPATSAAEAKVYVDRLIDYMSKPAGGEWSQRVVLTADDGDASIHLTQTEQMYDNIVKSSRGKDLSINKVYFGAYTLSNGVYAEAVSTFRREIEAGVLLWGFVGHATIDNLTGEGLMPPGEVYKLYLRKPLIFYGATCSFARWDGNRTSGVEALCMQESGGAVAAISAVRPVYIALNELMTNALGRYMFHTGSTGRFPSLGEAYMMAKNSISSDTNKRRYVLLGDPALRPAIPENRVQVTDINGVDPDDKSNIAIISALQKVTVKGRVTDPSGNPMPDFNGSLNYTIYDAEYSVVSNERDDKDNEVSFEQQGNRLAAGCAQVTGGEFEFTLTMPSEITDNFRPAAMTLYAVNKENDTDAASTFRDFFIYGFDNEATADLNAPVIEYMHLNHESFEDGATVNAAPMFVARVSDDTGINLSTAGVGHQMNLRIDGKDSYSDVASSFTPDPDGTPAGTVAYRLPELKAGEHTIEFKVWDVNGNSASKSLSFNVDASSAPSIFDLYTDASPATSEANFYLIHDRPDEILNVTIEVFDFNGRLQWSDTSTGRADMYSSAPVKWNLVNNSGQRVGRGIYLYRARVASASSPELESASSTRRLAVAPR